MHLEPPTSPKSDDSDTSSVASHVETEPFVKDALKWLIGNSQKSNSIDTAIGALAIGKVHVEAADFKKQINLHLMKHFSDCFTSGKDRARLQPSHRHNAMQSAWNYVNWMSYFAGGNSEGITSQLLDFIQDDTLGVELVIRLGLALASLAEQTNLPPEAGKNVAFWLSAFVRWYDEEKIYLTEEMLSTLIEGITLVSCHVHLDTAPERIHVLAGPHLINILWKVSHMNGSKLRSSIGVNLAVVALTTNGLAYHILDKQRAVSAAHYLAFDFRSTEDRNESFISLVLFALLGFIHPRSELALDQHTVDTASRIIRETQYLERQNVPMRIPRLVDLDPLRRYLTSMLIEAMTRTSDNETLIATAFIHVGEWNAHAVFPSIIYAVCSLITAHLEKKTTLYQDTLRSATDLLFREVQNLRRLDTAIIGFESHNVAPNDLSGSQDIQSVEDDPQNDGQPVQKEQIASSTLALIMERSNDKHCLETAVCAILTHTQKCDADLVMKAASWFEKKFSSIDHDENPDETRLLHMCGYVRILTSMALHCTDSDKLAADLCISNLQLYKSIEKKINILTTKSKDIYICAFGLGGLAVWSFAGPNTICEATDTQDILGNAWDMVIEQAKHSVRPEAIEPSSLDDPLKHDLFSEAVEVLVNTTALLAAVTNPLRTITPLQSQGLLRLLAQYRSTVEGPVRLALAVALAFWGLSLDKWDFWCPEMRQKCWREWTQSKTRNRDAAALFLLGLSRFLAHYSDLKLDHASIRTIAFEIDRYMQKHASQPDTLTLAFLSGFDVRRHVRESVWQYLQKTESHGPFTRSAAACREKLKSAVQYDGGEGFVYEEPQPFARRPRDSLSGTGGGKEDPAMSKIREREASEISEQGAATALLG
ncbi:hypothetical protein FRC07_000606 [Ceratobasidium sp. 392]|nr:hypothetical protein FRC07_000606 [Ceratobasidium sp. 392]